MWENIWTMWFMWRTGILLHHRAALVAWRTVDAGVSVETYSSSGACCTFFRFHRLTNAGQRSGTLMAQMCFGVNETFHVRFLIKKSIWKMRSLFCKVRKYADAVIEKKIIKSRYQIWSHWPADCGYIVIKFEHSSPVRGAGPFHSDFTLHQNSSFKRKTFVNGAGYAKICWGGQK